MILSESQSAGEHIGGVQHVAGSIGDNAQVGGDLQLQHGGIEDSTSGSRGGSCWKGAGSRGGCNVNLNSHTPSGKQSPGRHGDTGLGGYHGILVASCMHRACLA